jgi:hypothetical protein
MEGDMPLPSRLGGYLEPRPELFERQAPADERNLRHVMLSQSRGVITELERVVSTRGSGDMYVIRYHKASRDAAKIFDAGSWIGFRYRDANWSFVKQTDS